MAETSRKISRFLLQSKAVILKPMKPFTWASGWLSPIYCDNRLTLSYPEIRSFIRDAYISVIQDNFPSSEVIAGVATGAIAQGALVAEGLKLPFVYVRPSAKEHGRMNRVEGQLDPGSKVVVVEDLVSTGGSSLKAIEALREAGASVLGMVATFTYGFRLAEDSFREEGVPLITLTDYDTLIREALESGDITPGQLALLREWREDPSGWKGS